MFCPVCGGEYRDGFSVCADCDVALVVDRPAARTWHDEEGDDPHSLVSVLASADPDLVSAALGRLDAMNLPHSNPELPHSGSGDEDTLAFPSQQFEILVARGVLEEAERCLFGVAEGVEATNLEMERHGFIATEDEIPQAEIRYCPQCGGMHHGFSRCVDCDVPLVSNPPEFAEARRVPLFSTLDLDELAEVRRVLVQAGMPFEWGRLSSSPEIGAEEPQASPLVSAGWVYVTAAREFQAREALGGMPDQVAVNTDEEVADLEPGDDNDGDDSAGGDQGVLYCPRCLGEYRAGFSRCADCGATLVKRRPPTQNTNLAHTPVEVLCGSCGAPLPSIDAVCSRCSPPDDVEEPTSVPPVQANESLHSPRDISAPADIWWAISAGLPNARADHGRIMDLYRAARFTAWCGLIILPWISELIAFRQASKALAIVRGYGAEKHPMERRIERLRWLALAYSAAAWLALAAWLVERRPL